MSLKRNIIGNGLANLLQKLVRVFDQLLLVPFFISAWGAAYYGEWLTLTIIPSVLSFADLGFGTAAANSFVLAYTSGDKQRAADISKTGVTIITFVVLGGAILSALALTVINHLGLADQAIISASDALWAVSFMMVARLMSFYNQLFEAYFRAARKAAVGINLTNIQNVAGIGLGFLVLVLKQGIVVYAFSQFMVAVSFRFYYRWQARKVLALNKEYTGKFVKQYAKEIFTKGLGYLMSPMWQVVLFQGTTFVVRVTLGATAVAVFNTVRTLSRSINQIYSIINASVFPEVQFEIGAGNMVKARKIFLKSIQISLLLAFLGVLALAVVGLPLYNIWTHKTLNVPVTMWYIFLAGTLCNAVWWTSAIVFRAMNKPYQLTVTGLIAAGISVLISYFCCMMWGLNGAAVGSLIFEIIMIIYVLPASVKLMGLSVKHVFKKSMA